MRGLWRRIGTALDPATSAIELTIGLVVIIGVTSSDRLGVLPDGADGGSILRLGVATAIAWSLIDAGFTLLAAIVRAERLNQLRARLAAAERRGGDPDAERSAVADVYDEALADVLPAPERERVYRDIARAESARPRRRPRLTADDAIAAVAIALCGLVSMTVPLVPFLLPIPDAVAAGLANAVAVAGLFAVGAVWARYTTLRPVVAGAVLAGVGLAMVLCTLLLRVKLTYPGGSRDTLAPRFAVRRSPGREVLPW